jgi:SnoaL-like domain
MFGKSPTTRSFGVIAVAALALVGAALACGQLSFAAGNSRGGQLSVEARLQRGEDEKQIHDLLITYGRLLDTRDLDGYSQLFAKNGEWSGNLNNVFVTVKGPDAIFAMMKKAFSGSPYDPDNVTSFHLITNILINVDGDRATAYSKWTVMSKNSETKAPVARMGGHYDDVLVREGGTWKFLSRSAPRDIPSLNDR